MALGLVTASGGQTERKEPLPVKEGGTGATTAAKALENLGAASSDHTHNLNDLVTGSTNWSGATIPVNKGGTGATTAAKALENLGAAPKKHTHTANELEGILSVDKTLSLEGSAADAKAVGDALAGKLGKNDRAASAASVNGLIFYVTNTDPGVGSSLVTGCVMLVYE